MAKTRAFLLFTLVLLLLSGLVWFKPICHHQSPTRAYHILVEALTNLKFSSPKPSQRNEDPGKPLQLLEYDPNINLEFVKKDSDILNDAFTINFGNIQSDPLVDEKDVVELTRENFSQFIAKNRFVLVNFYAPWCCFSQKLAPNYAEAATLLKGEGSLAVLAKVDCTKEGIMCMRYRIMGYPSLYLFVGGVHVDQYIEERTSDAMVTWVKNKMTLGVYNITSTEEAKRLLTAESLTVVAFMDSLKGLDSEELIAASKMHPDVNFYQTNSAEIAKVFQIDPRMRLPTLVILRKGHKHYTYFDDEFIGSSIAEIVSRNKLPLVINLTDENSVQIFENPMKKLWLFACTNDSGLEKVMPAFQEAAKAFKAHILFVYVEMSRDDVKQRLAYQFCASCTSPKVMAYTGKDDTKMYELEGELSLNNIQSFAKELLMDKVSSMPISFASPFSVSS